ncbi:hypothetical protein GE115_08345 [Agromyces sp. CFH 90414]|uniref:Uncharacterized protein n=1 Tax=Agromyces agglutinans TaxID=2662258 RepID=A0A6I2F7W9_9MICO|nr:hypothetical protein [Agromyces agglutinans]MRG59877.1 hypothetical protein [Agromyces agglutinans]
MTAVAGVTAVERAAGVVVVSIEPWNPWPLVFPIALLALGVAASIAGARRRSKPMREAGYAGVLVGGLLLAALPFSLAGMWDSGARIDALRDAGYESATFSGALAAGDEAFPPLAFQAVHDGERVRGTLHHLDGDRWEIREVESSGG